jgi:anti-sigma28 factor (negative regulator of flagellin synthesis)
MDRFDNPRDPAEPANETETCETRSDSEPLIDDARREKIESLKKAVADGTYTVSAEEVARKLIEHMLEPKE